MDEKKTYTAFTNELLYLLKNGIQKKKRTLTLEEIEEHLANRLAKKNLPKPQSISALNAYKLEIAYNLAYPAAFAQLEETLLNQAIEKSQQDISAWKQYLPKLDFKQAIAIVQKQFIQDKKHGNAAIFLLQDTQFMREDLCISEIKDFFKKQATEIKDYLIKLPRYPVGIPKTSLSIFMNTVKMVTLS